MRNVIPKMIKLTKDVESLLAYAPLRAREFRAIGDGVTDDHQVSSMFVCKNGTLENVGLMMMSCGLRSTSG
jgi:hypothetical protein